VGADSKTKEPEPEKWVEEPAGEVITEATEPLAPEKKFRYRFRRSRDRNYYKSIPWPAWWDEFNSAIDKNGRRKYRTTWGFICAKTKIHWQRTILWEMIGPEPGQTTSGNSQGSDVGSQYRSAIFFHTPEQEVAARRGKELLEASGKYERPVTTQICSATAFYPVSRRMHLNLSNCEKL
jgi:hypothetical protein